MHWPQSLTDTTTLHNGVQMPRLGLGTWRASGDEVTESVKSALALGYRHIDTASIYDNEEQVGKAMDDSGLPREQLFITTKCWGDEQRDGASEAYKRSLDRLGIEAADLYLLHWPVENVSFQAWADLEDLYDSGRVRAIGVSNFLQEHLEPLLARCRIVPMVNQVEHHPRLNQRPLQDYCRDNRIEYESWAPLMRGKVNDIAQLQSIGHKYRKTPAQIALRWQLQIGVVTIPKSVHRERIAENADVFDFHLTEDELRTIDALDQNQRIGADPNKIAMGGTT